MNYIKALEILRGLLADRKISKAEFKTRDNMIRDRYWHFIHSRK